MKTLITILLMILLLASIAQAQAVEEIYSQDGEFLGNMGSKYDAFSIYNPDGIYGNELSPLRRPGYVNFTVTNPAAWSFAPIVYWMDMPVGVYNQATPWTYQIPWRAEKTVQDGIRWWVDKSSEDRLDYLSKDKDWWKK